MRAQKPGVSGHIATLTERLSSEFPCASSLPQMQKDFAAQMAACVRHINAEYEVDDLCSSFPERLAELRKAKGERLSH